MTTEPYVPDEGYARFAYVDGLMDYGKPFAGQLKELRAEFDRFVAKVKADTLREAAGIARSYGSDGVYAADEIDMAASRIEGEA